MAIDCAGGRGGGMNSKCYQEQVLDRVLKAFYTQMEEERGSILFQHDASSPDLNPIEPVWHELEWILHSLSNHPNTIEQLCAAILAAWEDLAIEDVKKHVDQMPDRVEAVAKKEEVEVEREKSCVEVEQEVKKNRKGSREESEEGEVTVGSMLEENGVGKRGTDLKWVHEGRVQRNCSGEVGWEKVEASLSKKRKVDNLGVEKGKLKKVDMWAEILAELQGLRMDIHEFREEFWNMLWVSEQIAGRMKKITVDVKDIMEHLIRGLEEE
ncbi:hypothetical protein PILCRDRAFT_1902 [Piloderma croceum F 1598]|uniref:Uncharacterized protein n=1 Tax=Piloderma croceum (strain F 1598) TaxID=765440 RepID=A0A0C3BSP1_PILCF|nr:hypothetical protein PILCRDRAFT_1902 [Piloderma croceum F 1598]